MSALRLRPSRTSAPKKLSQHHLPRKPQQPSLISLRYCPEREVIVPDETPQPARKPKVVANEAPPPEDDSKRYQVASAIFCRQAPSAIMKTLTAARAQILLLGLDAKVELVEANGDRWHRVYVGPFLTHNTLSSARSKLINESIDTLVIRQKTP